MHNRLLLLTAALAVAFASTPSDTWAASSLPVIVGENLPEASLFGAAAKVAPRAPIVLSYRSAVARVSPSVVTIHAAQPAKPVKGKVSDTVLIGVGSGVVVSRDGDIVTNHHVVQDATQLEVVLSNGTVLPARVLGVDPESDLALLHVDATGLQPIVVADIEDVQPGDIVLAIGNPLGIGQSVSQGIVSAVVRNGSRPIENFIQTDAAINPGNSGGALVNTAGHLVGINALILSQSGGSEGVGFAIPVDLVQAVAASLKRQGRVARGWLGWIVAPSPQGEGAIVLAVQRNGPAHRAGIVTGDIVTRVGARSVHRPLDAADVVLGSEPGTHVTVETIRQGARKTMDVELGPVPKPQAPL